MGNTSQEPIVLIGNYVHGVNVIKGSLYSQEFRYACWHNWATPNNAATVNSYLPMKVMITLPGPKVHTAVCNGALYYT